MLAMPLVFRITLQKMIGDDRSLCKYGRIPEQAFEVGLGRGDTSPGIEWGFCNGQASGLESQDCGAYAPAALPPSAACLMSAATGPGWET